MWPHGFDIPMQQINNTFMLHPEVLVGPRVFPSWAHRLYCISFFSFETVASISITSSCVSSYLLPFKPIAGASFQTVSRSYCLLVLSAPLANFLARYFTTGGPNQGTISCNNISPWFPQVSPLPLRSIPSGCAQFVSSAGHGKSLVTRSSSSSFSRSFYFPNMWKKQIIWCFRVCRHSLKLFYSDS